MPYRSFFVGVLLVVLAGCQNSNVYDVIGGAYEAQRVLAESIHQECGNAVPGGACVASSAISTDQKNAARAALDRVDEYTDAAKRLADAGSGGEALTVLQRATALLDEIERMLIEWGE